MNKRKIVLQQVCDFNRSSISTSDVPDSIIYLDTGNITRNNINKLQLLTMEEGKYPSRAKRKVEHKTIIYSTVRPNQEHYGIMNFPEENFIVSTGFTTIDVTDDNLDPLYLYYSLTRNEITEYLQNIAETSVSSYPSINPEDIGGLSIEVPVLREDQEKISSALLSIDSKIMLNNKILTELKAMIRTLFNYWFIQFDFPNTNKKPYKTSSGKLLYNTSLRRKIPLGWEMKKLSDIVDLSTDSIDPIDFPNKEFKYYSIPEYDKNHSYSVEKGKEIKSSKFVVSSHDILVSKLNPWFSRVVLPVDDNDVICSTEFVVWRSKNVAITNFLYLIATGNHFIKYCTKSATGTSNSHKRINPKIMMDYSLPFNEELVTLYSNKIQPAINTIKFLSNQNYFLKRIRRWLHPMLLNGQVKIQ